jgi:hypothetical protein
MLGPQMVAHGTLRCVLLRGWCASTQKNEIYLR